MENNLDLIIVTGLSGSGKTTVLKILEDCGYYCVDNIPLELLHTLLMLLADSEKIKKAALIIDARDRNFANTFRENYRLIKESFPSTKILFLTADDDVIVRRYKEARKLHPISNDGTILDGVRKERRLMKRVVDLADIKIDTSNLTVNQLRKKLASFIFKEGEDHFRLIVVTFGFKYGIPGDADMVFDVRCVKNPFFVDELKWEDGTDERVQDYVLKHGGDRLINKIMELLLYMIPEYKKEGKNFLIVAIGCTGGRHRSVAVGEILATRLNDRSIDVSITHRDMEKL